MPRLTRDILECLLKSLRLILIFDPYGGDVCCLADEDELDPPGGTSVAMASCQHALTLKVIMELTFRRRPLDQIASNRQ